MEKQSIEYLERIASALERIAPAADASVRWHEADAFVWNGRTLEPVATVSHVKLQLLQEIDHVRDILLRNTQQFSAGFGANNALLWGARGMGKSSLVKAIHAHINEQTPHALALIEIHREDLSSLGNLLGVLRAAPRRCVLFCDDLSFDGEDAGYKSLKALLDGGIEGRPDHVLFYATSNRRHLMPRDMVENEQSTAIHPGEAVEEKVSLSDRFGLWLGFHSNDQTGYLAMVEGYIHALGLPIERSEWQPQALEWSATRGSRSGRVAWQFIQDLCGRLSVASSKAAR